MDLVEAGVKFKVSSSRCLLDLKFNFELGLLEMPLLVINNHTEALIRNPMALELFRHGEKNYIMDYFYILNFLVNNAKDMDLLCDKGIVVNYLSDNKAATSMVKNPCTNFSWSCMNSDYNNICRELNAFYEKPLHRWKAFLRHEYFSTPLKVASSIPCLILLVLTLLQTVFAILQVVFKHYVIWIVVNAVELFNVKYTISLFACHVLVYKFLYLWIITSVVNVSL